MTNGVTSEARRVPDTWIDYDGHTDLTYYAMVFDEALDIMLDQELGVGPSYVKAFPYRANCTPKPRPLPG